MYITSRLHLGYYSLLHTCLYTLYALWYVSNYILVHDTLNITPNLELNFHNKN